MMANAIPGAMDAIARLNEAGLPMRFVSNTSRSNKKSILKQLGRRGFFVVCATNISPQRK
ncbi:hypothetical protein [Phyllobacterium bourgognense]|uniref:hypothetical protein n=1 Tax=Phyllobacterium bourgognense TaxID=314236 RepID=UPI000DF13A51